MAQPDRVTFKAYEIEELADVYFFRPLGMALARAACAVRLTPTSVTIVGTAVGVAGGALLAYPNIALFGFALIILHGILDSSDGQLARMTGRVTELGRLLDGAGGYLTHAAIYAAILPSSAGITTAATGMVWVILAALSNIVHAQMYDYHRSRYARIVIDGVAHARVEHSIRIARVYEAMQTRLAGWHHRVEAGIAARSLNGIVRPEDRVRYRACFYHPVRGWNLLGDNTRFYAIGVLAWAHHLDWFFMFLVGPMNAAFAVLWLWQARADRRFLAGL